MALVGLEAEPFLLRVEGWRACAVQVRVYGFDEQGLPERSPVRRAPH